MMMSYGGQRFGMSGIGSIAAPFFYAPNLGSVGSKAAYFPGNVHEDARALNFLGFLSDAALDNIVDSLGSQASDMENEGGAWDPSFRAGMVRLQNAAGITPDSWIGPQSRGVMVRLVAAKNASTPPNVIPPPVPALPPAVVPVNPGGVPAKPAVLPGVTPASATEEDHTMTYVAAGVGAVVLLGVGYWALK